MREFVNGTGHGEGYGTYNTVGEGFGGGIFLGSGLGNGTGDGTDFDFRNISGIGTISGNGDRAYPYVLILY